MTSEQNAVRLARRISAVAGASMVLTAAGPALAQDRAACDAAYDQAQTFRDQKKLTLAREQLRVCARSTCPRSMVKDCVGWLAETERAIPSVVLVATDASGSAMASVKVTIDGAGTPRALDGTSWDVDPGSHTFSFVAPDGTKADKSVMVVEGQRDQRVSVAFTAAPKPAAVPEPVPTPTPASAPEPAASPTSFPYKTVGFVTGGVGVAGLVAGSIFGAMALSTKGSNCPTETTCAPGTAQKALEQGTVSTVAFVAGGVLAAAGVTLVLLAPKSDSGSARIEATPTLATGAGGILVRGNW